jgi:hypothetical protein
MGYLWKMEEKVECFKELEEEDEENMEEVNKKLFIRFVKILMNDEVFMMDEEI